MQIASFIFLNRKWEEDKLILSKLLRYYAHMNHKTQVRLQKMYFLSKPVNEQAVGLWLETFLQTRTSSVMCLLRFDSDYGQVVILQVCLR